MDLTEHRREYASYCSEVELEKFGRHSGRTLAFDLRRLEERYADLWTEERVAALRRALDEAPAEFETERAGLRALHGASSIRLAESRAREVTEELNRCERSARITWGGEVVPALGAEDLHIVEADAARRGELHARRLEALRACEDLRAARLASLGEAVRSLGFAGRRSLYESFTGTDPEALAAEADLFLGRTERAYLSELAAWTAAAAGLIDAPRAADAFLLMRSERLDSSLPFGSFRAVYTATLAGLGVRAEAQGNLRLDTEQRPGKESRTACFPVKPPNDVRLVIGTRGGGADFYRRSLAETGRAQMFAWASRDTAARRPEFIYAPDAATELGHSFLLAGLLGEDAWLGEFARSRAHERHDVARWFALAELYEARRDCAVLGHALVLDRADDPRSDTAAAAYAETLTSATGFRHDRAAYMLDADEWFGSATRLRARAFAAGCREHLRRRYGRRWFVSRQAGDELIDVWNTASRYGAEDLTRLVWGGEPGLDLLADLMAEAVESHG